MTNPRLVPSIPPTLDSVKSQLALAEPLHVLRVSVNFQQWMRGSTKAFSLEKTQMSPNNANATPQKPMYDPFLDPEEVAKDHLRATQRAAINALVAGPPPKSTLTMTSRQIAEVTRKPHRKVVRDIEKMLQGLQGVRPNVAVPPEGVHPKLEGPLKNVDLCVDGPKPYEIVTYVDPQNKRTFDEYILDQELTYTLVTGYSVTLRNSVVKRWLELEAKERNKALPEFISEAEPFLTRPIYDEILQVAFADAQLQLLGVVNKRFKTWMASEFVLGGEDAKVMARSSDMLEFYGAHARELLKLDPTKRVYELGDAPGGFTNNRIGN